MSRLRLLQPLRDRRYARYWMSSALSFSGDGLYVIAVAWHAAGLPRPALALSLVGIATTAPNLIATLLGGALADRLDRRTLLLVADLVRTLAIGAMAALAWVGVLELIPLVALVGLFGLASAVANPTITAYLPCLVEPEALPQANALLSMTRTLAARVVGPVASGALIAFAGTGICFLLDAASFAVSAAVLLSLPAHKARAASGKLLAQVREGLRYVRSEPWLTWTLLCMGLGTLLYIGPFYVLLPLLVREEFNGSAGAYSAIWALGGVAAFAGAALAGHLRPSRPLAWAYAGWVLAFTACALYGLAPSLPLLALVAAVSLGAGVSAGIVWTSLVQARVPDELLGRVSSLDALATLGLAPLSMALAVPAAELVGIRAVFLVCGALAAAIQVAGALLIFRSQRRRTPNLDPVASAEPVRS